MPPLEPPISSHSTTTAPLGVGAPGVVDAAVVVVEEEPEAVEVLRVAAAAAGVSGEEAAQAAAAMAQSRPAQSWIPRPSHPS